MVDYWYDFPSNFTNITGGQQSVEGVGSFFQYLSVITNHSLGFFITFMVMVISFLFLGGESFGKRASASMFITLIVSVLLMRAGLVAFPLVIVISVITMIAILVLRDESNQSTGGL